MSLPGWASRYIGVPYRNRGSDFDGCDCQGLVDLVWREERGWPPLDYAGSGWPSLAGSMHDMHARLQMMKAHAQACAARYAGLTPGEERELDVVVLRVHGVPCHVGVVLTPGQMLHIEKGTDCVVETYRGLHWSRRIVGFYRHGHA